MTDREAMTKEEALDELGARILKMASLTVKWSVSNPGPALIQRFEVLQMIQEYLHG